MEFVNTIKTFIDNNIYLFIIVAIAKIFKLFTLFKNICYSIFTFFLVLFKKEDRKFLFRKIRLMFSGFDIPKHLKKDYRKAYYIIKYDTIRSLYWIHSQESKDLVSDNLQQNYIYELKSLGLITEKVHKVIWGGHPPVTVKLSDLGILLCKNLNPNFEFDSEEYNKPIRPIPNPKWEIDPLDIALYNKISKSEIANLLSYFKKYDNLTSDKQNDFKRNLEVIINNLNLNIPLDLYYEYKKKIIDL